MGGLREAQADERRLEALWAGQFGDAYVERNRLVDEGRAAFWQRIMQTYRPARVLEVGCNVGANLRWITAELPPEKVFGLDINLSALAELRAALPGVNAVSGRARDLPFGDRWFDLVFTAGVLIH